MMSEDNTRILLVDDDQNLLTSLCDILEYKGFVTLRANKGTLALEIIGKQKVDVALVDLRLEDTSGLELIKAIKNLSPYTECILLTGYATQSSAIEAIGLGAFGYYQKPFDIDQVVLAIHQAAEKSKSAEALAASSRRLQALIQNGRDHIAVVSVDGILLWASPLIEEKWGYITEENDDLKQSSMIHPDELGSLLSTLQEVAQTPECQKDIQFRLRRRGGDWRWVEGTVVNLLEDPAIRGLVINFRDITEQKEIQDRLRLHGSALEAAANAIVIADREGNVQWVNSAFEKLTGFSRKEAIGQNPRFLNSGFQDSSFYQNMWDSILSGKMWHSELVNKRKDGSLYNEEMKITPLLDEKGMVEYFIAIKQDVTERKQYEFEVAASEIRYHNLFENSPIAMMEEDFSDVKIKLDALRKRGVKDWHSYFMKHPGVVKECIQLVKVLDVNQACLKLHKVTEKEDLIVNLTTFLPDESLDIFASELVAFAERKKNFSSETVNRTITGDPLDISISWTFAPGHEKDLSKLIVTLVDVSERKKHEKAIEKQNRELDLLYTAGRILSQTLDLKKIYHSFYELVSGIIKCDTMYISDFDPETQMIKARFAAIEGNQVDIKGFQPVPLGPEGQGIQSPVIRSGKSLVINDYWAEMARAKTNTHIFANGIVNSETDILPESPYAQSALVIPILLNEQVRGVIQILSFVKNSYDENDLVIAESLVSQIAVAINNASLYQQSLMELEARVKAEQELLQKNLLQEKIVAMGRELASSLELPVIYSIAERHLKTMIDCPKFSIILFDTDHNELVPAYVSSEGQRIDTSTIPPMKFDLSKANSGRAKAIATRSPVIVNELEKKRKAGEEILVGNDKEPQSAIYMPMLAEDKVIGLLDLQSYQVHAYSDDMDDWLEVVSNQVGLAIQNARLHADIVRELAAKGKAEEEIRQSLGELEMLYNNALLVNQILDPIEIGKAMIDIFSKRFAAHHVVIRLRKKESDILDLAGYYVPGLRKRDQPTVERRFREMVNKVGDGLSGWVVVTGQTLRIGDVKNDPHYVEAYPGIRSGLYVPIKIGLYVIGCITLESEDLNAFTEREERLVQTIANQAAIAFENAYLYKTVQEELVVRKNTESALRESQGRLQSILDHTSALVYIKDLEGRYTLVNKAMTRVMGLSSEQIIGEKPGDVIDYPEAGAHTENDKLVLQKRAPITFEEYHTLGTNTNVFLSVKFPIMDDQGEIIGLCGISTDITEQKAAEEQLKLLSHTVEQSPASVVITDPDGNIEYVNRKFTEATGYKLDEVVGKNPRIVKSGYTTQEEYQELWETIKAGKEWRGEFNTRRKDSSLFWESALISPIMNNENQTTHFLAVKEDITARKEAEFELLRLNQELEERVNRRTVQLNNANIELEKASKLKDEFLASMSHELRTPLTGVLGLSEALQKGVYGDINEKQVNILQTIEEGGRHLLNLINDILDLSKIEAGKMDLQPSIVSVDEVCQASLRLVKQMASSRHHKLAFNQTPLDMLFYADAKRMKQILVNLLGNAVKFTPEGGEIGLEVIGDEKNDVIRFIVWDNGIGIAQEDMEKLFLPFVQIDSSLSRNYAGTGLGLSLVDRLVSIHGGTIDVSSVIGQGSRFTISIPWLKEKINAFESRIPDQTIFPVQVGGKENLEGLSGLVLVVEDNNVNSKMLSDFLTFNGYKVIIANSGEEGLTLCQTQQPDVVLMDIQIPGIDGYQLIQTIRKMKGAIASVAIIALTALAMPEDRQRCLDAGANEYMSKPIDMTSLLNAINRLKRKMK